MTRRCGRQNSKNDPPWAPPPQDLEYDEKICPWLCCYVVEEILQMWFKVVITWLWVSQKGDHPGGPILTSFFSGSQQNWKAESFEGQERLVMLWLALRGYGVAGEGTPVAFGSCGREALGASEETGPSVLQLEGTEFRPQPGWTWKQICPQIWGFIRKSLGWLATLGLRDPRRRSQLSPPGLLTYTTVRRIISVIFKPLSL